MSSKFKFNFSPDSIPSEEEANQAAISEIRSLFQSSDQIASRVASFRAEYQKKKAQVDAQLSNLVHTQIEESRYALELLGMSCSQISRIRQNFLAVDQYCKECQKLIPDYERVKKVAVARANLGTTIGLLTLFRSIPKKATELQSLIEDDRQLKNIYKEIRRLVALRDKAFSKGLQYSDNIGETVRESFEALQQVALDLEDRIWLNIRDCISLSREDPATLVRTLEVIEMEDRERVKIFAHNLVMVDQNAAQRSCTQTMRERCFFELEKSIADEFGTMFGDKKADDDRPAEEFSLRDTLRTANNLIEDLEHVSEFMVKCFPPDYHIFNFYEQRYQKWLCTRLIDAIGDPTQLSGEDILFTVNWIQEYKLRMRDLQADMNTASELEQYSETLMDSFIQQSKIQMMTWVANILRREREAQPKQDEHGVYTTDAAQDLFFLTINQQVKIAFENLRGKNFVNSIKMCADVLRYFQEGELKFLNDPSVSKSEEYLCAVINTLHTCAEETSSLKERCVSHVEMEDSEVAEALEEYLDDVVTGFVTISNRSAQLLATHIMNTMDTVLNKAFVSEWLVNDTWTEEAILTLQDFFGDYNTWLASEFYLGKIIKDVCHQIVTRYISRLVDVKPQNSNDPSVLWARVEDDRKTLVTFFTNDQWGHVVPPEVIQAEYEGIIVIREILRAEEAFISVYFERIIQRFENRAVHVFTELLSMRTDIDRSTRRELIERFKQQMPKEEVKRETTYSLPSILGGRSRDTSYEPVSQPSQSSMFSSLWQKFNR
eukprot:TRINITY_DN6276_c0_g1_i2.p1 TRINITY_DN6276_c0_g1~~TRINITY_DN6276_c0_g1_i2.p1  ORF type:complete len:774 (-),score=175.20 TRINITY_DN6276_c0_g1_i2:58-2379(-)